MNRLELPFQITAYMGYCPVCDTDDRLIFVMRDAKGQFEHCMICKKDWRTDAS